VRVRDENGKEIIHLVEFQTKWKKEKIWSMVQYKARYAQKYKLPIKSTMVLLVKSKSARDFFKEEEISFKFRLVKMWELPAKQYIANQCLLPMTPLMDGGMELVPETERLIYESKSPKMVDNLMIFSILTGLRDKNLSLEIIKRRRDIVVESPVYDMILQEGMLKGRQEGLYEGLINARLETARNMLKEGEPIEKISRFTGLTLEELQKIRL